MKLRTIYFKTTEIEKSTTFWSAFLQAIPTKQSSSWVEYMVGETRIAFLLNDYGDKYAGSNLVPVFEFATEEELQESIKRAGELGAETVTDGLHNPEVQSMVLKDIVGNEFELTRYHD